MRNTLPSSMANGARARTSVNSSNLLPRAVIDILSIRVDDISLNDLIGRVENFVTSNGRYRVMYANVHVLNTAYNNPELQRILNQADLAYCDGAGVQGVNWERV